MKQDAFQERSAMPERYRTVRLNALMALLLLGISSVAPVASQEITLEPGQSCQSAGCHEAIGQKKVVHMPASNGSMCVMCHEASAPTEHNFKPKAQGGALCNTCHNVLGDKKNQHMPVQMGMCTMCHDPHQSDNRRLLKAKPVAGLCKNCHSAAMFEGETVHGPVAEGNCTSCHEPHASENAKLVKVSAPELCFDCHNRSLKDANGKELPAARKTFDNAEIKKHMPFGAGMCAMCHVPHASENHRLLSDSYPADFYTSFAVDKYFCFGCHDAGAFAEPRTLAATRFRNGNLNLHHRHVNRDKGRTCRACHDHHGAKNEKLIRDRVPFGNRSISITDFELTETGGQCGPTCHTFVRYDRFDPVQNGLRVSTRQGEDASPQELKEVGGAQSPD
jgi:predicted CXXCH cytochrome family protein